MQRSNVLTAIEEPMGNAGPFIEVDRHTRLFYRHWGTGQPVLFLHSWALNSDMWQYQVVHLQNHGLRCIAYDARGHGRSSDPGRGYDYDTFAADLAQVIDQLDLHNLTLVSHSMATGTVVRYLSKYGAGRVARSVLLAPTTPFFMKTADNPEGVDERVIQASRAAWRHDYPKWLGDNARPFVTPETSSEMVAWLIGLMLQPSLQALLATNCAMATTDFRTEMAGITVPTLIIHGDADVSAPLDLTGRRSARLIPKSQLTVYEGAPHGLFVTHIDRFNRDLLDFIQGPPAVSSDLRLGSLFFD